jgi:hypothetical protein
VQRLIGDAERAPSLASISTRESPETAGADAPQNPEGVPIQGYPEGIPIQRSVAWDSDRWEVPDGESRTRPTSAERAQHGATTITAGAPVVQRSEGWTTVDLPAIPLPPLAATIGTETQIPADPSTASVPPIGQPGRTFVARIGEPTTVQKALSAAAVTERGGSQHSSTPLPFGAATATTTVPAGATFRSVPLQRMFAAASQPPSSPAGAAGPMNMIAGETHSQTGERYAEFATEQRQVEFQGPSSGDLETPHVQRQDLGTPAPVASQETVQTASISSSGGAPPAQASGAHPSAAASTTDIEELAKRLYEPLSARLRAELWLDRERAGLVTDRRR